MGGGEGEQKQYYIQFNLGHRMNEHEIEIEIHMHRLEWRWIRTMYRVHWPVKHMVAPGSKCSFEW